MPVLNQQPVADSYQTTKAKINDVWNSVGGWFSVTGAPVLVQVQYGVYGDSHTVEDIEFGTGAFVVLPPSVKGIQFRNAVAGQTATITVQLAQGDEPPLLVSSVGTVTLVAGNINFQHNDVAVATENTADFEDAAYLQFTVVDDPPNTRAKIGLLNVSLADKAPASAQVFTGPVEHVSAASTDLAFAAGATGDTFLRFQVNNSGVATWGPGNAVTDTTLQRVGVGNLQIGTSTQRGVLGVIADAAGSSTLLVRVTSDANYRYTVTGDGTTSWGPGTAPADTTLARSAANQLDLGTTTQEGRLRLFGAAAGDLALQLLVTTDTNPRLAVSYDGTHNWGTGALATDTTWGRIAAAVVGSSGSDIVSGGQALAVGGGPGTQMHVNGTFASATLATTGASLTTTVTGDTTDFRFKILVTGEHRWAAANTAFDTSLARIAAGVLGTALYSTGPLSRTFSGAQTAGVFIDQANGITAFNTVAFSLLASGQTADTTPRFSINSNGLTQWGPGNAAVDIALQRIVNGPTGTGTFLEMTTGAGLGYGTGTGGTATIVSGSSGTINKPTGKVTASASVANGATGSYTVTNSVVGVDDVVALSLVAGGGNIQRFFAKVAAGSFTIDYENSSGVAQTPVFTFVVIKGAVA